jgi:hypothetical protein
MTAALSLVPDEPEQLLLRPVDAFARWFLPEPWVVVCARRRPPQRKPPGAKVVEAQVYGPVLPAWKTDPTDLETYRAPVRRAPARAPAVRPKRVPARQVPKAAPIRPTALRVVAPRRQRPGARPRSVGLDPLTLQERAQLARDEAWLRAEGILQGRPVGEGNADCTNIPDPDPCPWIGCRLHLGKEVDEITGALKRTFPDREVWEMSETCAIRAVRSRGALSLEEVGKLTNVTEEWVRQIELGAVRKLRRWAKGRRRVPISD